MYNYFNVQDEVKEEEKEKEKKEKEEKEKKEEKKIEPTSEVLQNPARVMKAQVSFIICNNWISLIKYGIVCFWHMENQLKF